MGEWLKPAVLKTVSGVTRSGVRIPLPPPQRSLTSIEARPLVSRVTESRPIPLTPLHVRPRLSPFVRGIRCRKQVAQVATEENYIWRKSTQ